MLTIRADQMAAFRRSASLTFESDMISHLSVFAPGHAKLLGIDGLRAVVRFGRERAFDHGFTLRGPVRFYLELTFLLGAAFDTDPQYPWAVSILGGTGAELPRADRLHAATMDYLDAVAGPDNTCAKAALHRMKATGLELAPTSGPGFETWALAEMRRLYAEKCAYAGQPALEALIELGTKQAEALGAPALADRAFCIGMMFALGHGYATDPHMPWIQKTLVERGDNGPQRIAALRIRTATYLDAVLRSFGGV